MGPVPETNKQRSREAVGHCRTHLYRHSLLDRLCHQLTMEDKPACSSSGPPLSKRGHQKMEALTPKVISRLQTKNGKLILCL